MKKLNLDTGNGIMEISVTDITPEYAKELLLCNTNNRNVKKSRVEIYSRDMANGKWLSNGMPFIIGDDGVLKDGQHRLLACIASGVTLKNQVVIYLPKQEANCYDIGAVRTTADTMFFQEVNNPALRNSSVISGITYIVRKRHGSVYAPVSKMEIIENLNNNVEACEFVYKSIVVKHTNINGIRRAGVIAAVICAYNKGYNYELLESFCKVLCSGIPKGQVDIGVIKLRDYLMNLKGSGAEQQDDVFYRTQNVLKSYENGKMLTVCRPASTLHYSYNI